MRNRKENCISSNDINKHEQRGLNHDADNRSKTVIMCFLFLCLHVLFPAMYM